MQPQYVNTNQNTPNRSNQDPRTRIDSPRRQRNNTGNGNQHQHTPYKGDRHPPIEPHAKVGKNLIGRIITKNLIIDIIIGTKPNITRGTIGSTHKNTKGAILNKDSEAEAPYHTKSTDTVKEEPPNPKVPTGNMNVVQYQHKIIMLH